MAPEKTLLRLITCGSVDDGKSSLLGRLLFETGSAFEDELAHVGDDLSRLVDGLEAEGIEVASLYFAEKRPVVVRDGSILMVDDERLKLLPGEQVEQRSVRFRTLGCYPLSGAVESEAKTVPELIEEMKLGRQSERQGRLIDRDSAASMERKKREGYF